MRERGVGPRQLGVVGERELAAQLAPAIVEHRSRIERGELALGVARPGADPADRALGVGERGEDLDLRGAAGRDEPLRGLPVARPPPPARAARRRRATRARGADRGRGRSLPSSASSVSARCACRPSSRSSAARRRSASGMRSRVDERRQRAARSRPSRAAAPRARGDSATRVSPGAAAASRFERAQQRLAVAELAMRARDPREHVGILGPLAAQPLEPRQRRLRRRSAPTRCARRDRSAPRARRRGSRRAGSPRSRAIRSSAARARAARRARGAARARRAALGSASSAAR